MDLFDVLSKGAIFSEDGNHRFILWRKWDRSKPMIGFIGLNPSTANREEDDPTIRRVKRFAFDWGFGGVYMMNLFSKVTPYPKELTGEINQSENDEYLSEWGSRCREIVFAWGSFPEAKKRAEIVSEMFPEATALQINQNGTPKHPLYVLADIQRIKFNNQNQTK